MKKYIVPRKTFTSINQRMIRVILTSLTLGVLIFGFVIFSVSPSISNAQDVITSEDFENQNSTYTKPKTTPKKPATKPATTTNTTTNKPAITTPKAPVTIKNPTNLKNPTGETVDESGASGFVICGNTVDTPCNITHLFRTLIIIINYLISMAGLVAILFIVINGVRMIISQGTLPAKESDQSELTKAKKGLTGAITGLILVAVAFVLVNTLFAGSLNIGIKNGALILTNPKAYINEGQTPPSETDPLPNPETNTQGNPEKPVSENFDPINSGKTGTGEGASKETLADIKKAPTAEFCPLDPRANLDIIDVFANLFLIKTAHAQRVACTEVKTGTGTIFPYVLRQQEYPGNYPGCAKAGTVESGGCGPTALAMALWARHKKVGDVTVSSAWQEWADKARTDVYSPWAVAQLVAHTGGRGCYSDGEPNGSTSDFAGKVTPYYGITSFVTSAENQIDFALEHGNYVIARMRKNSRFTGGGHFILIWAKDNNYKGSGQKWYYAGDPNSKVDVRVARSTVFYEDLMEAQVLVFNPA